MNLQLHLQEILELLRTWKFIKVAQKLKKKSEILKFVIIGSGRNLNNLKNKIKNNNVENYFHFVGRIDPEFISSYFKLSDVLFISLIKSKIFH